MAGFSEAPITATVGISAFCTPTLTRPVRPLILSRDWIELPAGLVGDEQADEDILTAAGRELEEETGWLPANCRVLTRGPSSAGLTSEVCTLVVARDLRRTGPGGGVPGEGITVHEVPLAEVPGWLAGRAAAGVLIDHKIHAALWWLGHAA